MFLLWSHCSDGFRISKTRGGACESKSINQNKQPCWMPIWTFTRVISIFLICSEKGEGPLNSFTALHKQDARWNYLTFGAVIVFISKKKKDWSHDQLHLIRNSISIVKEGNTLANVNIVLWLSVLHSYQNAYMSTFSFLRQLPHCLVPKNQWPRIFHPQINIFLITVSLNGHIFLYIVHT